MTFYVEPCIMLHVLQQIKKTARRVPAKEILVQWLSKVWVVIPSAMIEYSFTKCGISNNLDGTDDDIMFEDVCRCTWPWSAMPMTRNQTRISGIPPLRRYQQSSSAAMTKVILKDTNYDMI